MASTYSFTSLSLPLPPIPNSLNPNKTHLFPTKLHNPNSLSTSISKPRRPKIKAANPSTAVEEALKASQEAMSIENLQRFVNVNLGKWNGCFLQFDALGNVLHEVNTKLSVNSYGEDELLSLIQTLYIKQAVSSGYEDEEEWAEYKIKETNMFTVDKYQQIGFFPDEKAFSLRYQTAGMLEIVLRQGVLGEDDTGEESPRNLNLPSRKPSIVCESCLYSLEKDMRIRAFQIMDPKGISEMLLIFLEERGDGVLSPPSIDNNVESTDRVLPFLGKWKGHSITKRSGVYGSTMAEADTVASLEIDDKGQIIQEITSTSAAGDVTVTVPWTGIRSDNLVTFNKGFQMALLPGECIWDVRVM